MSSLDLVDNFNLDIYLSPDFHTNVLAIRAFFATGAPLTLMYCN